MIVGNFYGDGKTVILTTHQRELAEPIANFLLTLQAGSVASLIETRRAAIAGALS